MIRTAVIGLRNMGLRRLKAVKAAENAAAMALCTRNPDLLFETGRVHGIESLYTDWRDIARKQDIDAVFVCVPNNLHYEIAMECLKTGKHVLVEYPMANTISEIDALTAAAEENKRILHLGLSNRHEPYYLKAVELANNLGEPVAAHGTMGLPRMWKWATDPETCGPFFSLANFHLVDQMVDLYGKPEQVSARLWQRERNKAVEKIFGSMFFNFSGGQSGYVTYGMGIPCQDTFMEFELIFSNGMVRYRSGRLSVNESGMEFREIPFGPDKSCEKDTGIFLHEIDHGEYTLSPGQQAVSTRLCILAQQSAECSGKQLAV